jgi:predicted dehydrogenase
VIGCGEIAQIAHLPVLASASEFELVALCDSSPQVLAHLERRYPSASAYADHRELLGNPEIEAVLVATYDHTDVVSDALRAQKHVLVEKPLAFTETECLLLCRSARESSRVAMVGYMRTFDRASRVAFRQIRALRRPRAVHLVDFAGRLDQHRGMYGTIEQARTPDSGQAAVRARVDRALGPGAVLNRELLITLLMLGSHDLALLRAAYGGSAHVRFALKRSDQHVLAILSLGRALHCTLELAIGLEYQWWEQSLTVYGAHESLRLRFSNPYVLNSPSTVTSRQAFRGVPSTVRTVYTESPYRLEWEHFYRVVRREAPLQSDFEGGAADVSIAYEIIRTLQTDA